MSKKRPMKINLSASPSGRSPRKKKKKDSKAQLIMGLLVLIIGLSVVLLTGFSNSPSEDLIGSDQSALEPTSGQAIANLAAVPEVKTASYHIDMSKIRPFMETYCYGCHNAKRQKGDVRLDDLPQKLVSTADAQLWQDALDAVNLGIMVPEEAKKMPSSQELEDFIAELTGELQNARKSFADSGGQVVLHRLNRREYVNTIYDLFKVTVNEKALPQDGLHEGFDTVGQSLYFSSLHFDRYLEMGQKIIKQIVKKGQKPSFQKKKIDGEWKSTKADQQVVFFTKKRERLKKQMDSGKTFKELRFNSQADMIKSYDYNKLVMDRYKIFKTIKGHDTGFLPYRVDHPWTEHFKIKIPDVDVEGDYTMRIRCAVTEIPGKKNRRFGDVQPLKLKDQTINDGEPEDFLRVYDVTAPYEKPEFIEYKFRMIPGQQREIDITGKTGVNNYRLWIDWVEWSGPHNVEWPSPGYKMLFFKGEGAPKSNEYARQIIENLALKTFRGQTPSAVFIDTLYGLYMKHRRSSSFEESLVLPLACILASPKFIYKFEQKSTSTKNLNQQELANRLSYFLWNSQPDEQLNFLAKKEQLSGQILKQQIARMFKDPRSDRFIDSFAIQWLELDKLNALTTLPGDLLYSARREPVEFFKHLLKNNLSYKNLVNSDFVVINQTLAKHYKIPGQESREFKAVPLKGKAERGGLLGQAAFMMMTSEGTRTSIVQRGSWVISKLLNSPPPPPPPNVPQLDPGKQKKKSALEMLNAHNSIAQCRSCHKRIDPLGYALESFDYLGIWRGHDRRFRIDVSGTMPDGKRSFKGLSEFKTRLMEDHERTLKGFIEGLLIYSLGRPLSFNDGELVEDLVQKSRNGNDGIYSIIESIILSPTFVKK